MKVNKRVICTGLVALLIGGATGLASANNLLVDVTAQLNYEVQMKHNGQDYNPMNQNNEAVRPLIYEGQVYLPESIIEETANINIDYNEENKEMWIGERNEKIYFTSNEFHPGSDTRMMSISGLYYTENPKELLINGEQFSMGLKAFPNASIFDNYYFHTEEVAGKVSVLGGSVYMDYSTTRSEIAIKFRKSRDEGAEIIEFLKVKPGEVVDFEIDTRGTDIVVMDMNSRDNDSTHIGNLCFLDLYYK